MKVLSLTYFTARNMSPFDPEPKALITNPIILDHTTCAQTETSTVGKIVINNTDYSDFLVYLFFLIHFSFPLLSETMATLTSKQRV